MPVRSKIKFALQLLSVQTTHTKRQTPCFHGDEDSSGDTM